MKHNVMKRTLAGVMAVLTVAAYMPANVGGFLTEGNGIGIVASAEGEATEVSDASAFKDAVEAGTSVKLTADIELASTVNVTKDVTIDLNGKNITANGARALWVKSGTLTLIGSGTITATGTIGNTSSVIRVGDGGSASDNKVNANLYVGKDVTVTSDKCYGVTVFGGATTETVDIYGTVSVSGSESAVSGNGNSWNAGTTINIYPGAEINATGDVAIYHPQAGTMNITGGTITGLGGIEAKAGTVNISGDTVVEATAEEYHKANGDGTSTRGRSVAAVEHNSYAGAPSFNINGGTFIGKAEIVNDNLVPESKDGSFIVTGGNFNTTLNADYITDGYLQEANGNVLPQNEAEFTITQDGTIQLTENTTYGKIKVAQGVNAVIDLNGFNLSLVLSGKDANDKKHRSIIVDKGASLEIKNTSDNAATVNEAMQTTVEDSAELTIGEGVTLYLPYVPANSDDGEVAIYYKKNSTVSIDGIVDAPHVTSAVSGNHDYSEGATLNITGTVSATDGKAIYHPHDGTLNITGGTVTGATAIYARTGTINISGGNISATGPVKAPNDIANGADPTGDAVAIQVYVSSYGTVPEVNITGGSFSSVNGKSVATYWAKAIDEAQMPTKFITGGNFGSDLNKSYIADGYVLDRDYNVVEATAQQVSTPVTITTIDVNGSATTETVYKEYYTYGDYVLPKAVYLDGYDFVGWKVNKSVYSDPEDANSAVSDSVLDGGTVTVQVVYKKIAPSYSHISVENGTITNIACDGNGANVEASTVVTVKADSPDTDHKFSHWLLNEKIVSYNPTYSFFAPTYDVTLKAVYVENTLTVEQKGTGFIEKVSKPDTNKMSFVSVLNVPDGCKMLKAGVVVQSTETLNGAALTVNNAKAIRYTDTSKNNYKSFRYTWTLTTSNYSKEWTVRPYLEYKDKSGKVQTIYGDAVSKSINALNN